MTRIELTRLQGTAARRAAEAKATMPHLVATAALAGPMEDGDLLAAVTRALHDVPAVNAAYVDGAIERREEVKVAVALPGPVAPVLRGQDPGALREEVAALRERDPEAFTAAELAGATFTVHGLGLSGLASLTPVLVPRQAAGLGVGERALTLVADARVLTPADLAAFLGAVQRP